MTKPLSVIWICSTHASQNNQQFPHTTKAGQFHCDQLTQTRSSISRFGFPRLPDLQEMSIRIVEEGPCLVAVMGRWGDKFGSARAKDLIGSRAVRNPYG
ncbi:hypothetical protein Krac_7631 [Ktedonobacter racemifer DSM 44963]|uniref:Uncharacterized protein n=1 Tax=Ktedonobacter racemifer DSM 44963 TaxID=485913 RepID=D6TKN8_KTERA|nr:hypothetical protein Krac_7631 [Ktedonobacter racemifer DSM 44963]